MSEENANEISSPKGETFGIKAFIQHNTRDIQLPNEITLGPNPTAVALYDVANQDPIEYKQPDEKLSADLAPGSVKSSEAQHKDNITGSKRKDDDNTNEKNPSGEKKQRV